MQNKGVQFIVGYFVFIIGLLIMNFVIKESVPVGTTRTIGINQEVYLFNIENSTDYVSFSFGILFFILPFIGGLINIYLGKILSKE